MIIFDQNEIQMYKYFLITILTLVLCNSGYGQSDVLAHDNVHNLEGRGFIKNWLVAGTFPSPEVATKQPDGSRHFGFYNDYLKGIGGEKEAVIDGATVIKYDNENGETISVLTKNVIASDSGIVDLETLFNEPDNVMAYAFSYVHSEKAQDVWFSLGSDDGVKVWVNGELVHSNYVGRGLTIGQDKFSVKLNKGNNSVLVKVIDMVNGWGVALEVLDEKAYAAEKEIERKKRAHIDSLIAKEELLWPHGIQNNPVSYDEQNTVNYGSYHPDAPLQISRSYSNVSTPTYYVYPASPENNTGVGMVILPGGGYNDVWLDAEGHNIALVFAKQGITSLVMKYRTNTRDKDGKRPLSRDEYLPAAIDDAKEGIRILRERAKELKLDPGKIGVGGFSAGGHLSLSVCVTPDAKKGENYPDFAFLIYPWLQKNSNDLVEKTDGLPPMFIVNGQEDTTTPADACAQFYYTLCKKEVPAELHIYSKGKHGFTLGLGVGHSTVQWSTSFVAWLKDIDMIVDN